MFVRSQDMYLKVNGKSILQIVRLLTQLCVWKDNDSEN